jgi:chromosome segregation ATPase
MKDSEVTRMRDLMDAGNSRESLKKRISQLEEEVDDGRRAVARREKETAAVHEALGVQEGLVLHAQNVEKSLRKQIDDLEALVKEREREAERERDKERDRERERDKDREQDSEKDREIDALKRTIQDLKDDINGHKRKMQEKVRNMDDLEQTVRKHERNVESLRRELDAATAEADSVKAAARDKEGKMCTLEGEAGVLREKNAQLLVWCMYVCVCGGMYTCTYTYTYVHQIGDG